MKSLIVALASFVSMASVAQADGFNCQTVDGDLNVKVYNKTHAEDGTRNAAVMVISDPTIQYGRKTIASFTAQKGTLAQDGTTYNANVDLRVSESDRSGENIVGTKLGQLDTITLWVDFSYAQPVADGTDLGGKIYFSKRNGDSFAKDVVCIRYLKN